MLGCDSCGTVPRAMFGRALTVAGCLALAACDRSARAPVHREDSAPAAPTSTAKPRLVTGALPIAPFVAEQLVTPGASHTVVYVGATWCEPCVRFHRALEQGELDAQLPGVRFIEYDFDAQKAALLEAGYRSRLLPLFALPQASGASSARQIEGSVKGPAGVENIARRLRELLALGPVQPR